MGWTSTADTLENVARASLFFYTKEEAADFCTKHGWEYSIDLPNERKAARAKRFNAYSESKGLTYMPMVSRQGVHAFVLARPRRSCDPAWHAIRACMHK